MVGFPSVSDDFGHNFVSLSSLGGLSCSVDGWMEGRGGSGAVSHDGAS